MHQTMTIRATLNIRFLEYKIFRTDIPFNSNDRYKDTATEECYVKFQDKYDVLYKTRYNLEYFHISSTECYTSKQNRCIFLPRRGNTHNFKSKKHILNHNKVPELRNLLGEEKVEDAGGTLQADSLTLWEKKDSLLDS